MNVLIIISIIFQLSAILIAIKLIKITEKYFVWVLLAITILFMLFCRFFALISVINDTKNGTGSSIAEVIALIVSISLLVGFYLMIPIFKSIKKTEKELQKQNKEYATINKELIIAKKKAEESDKLKTEFINNMSHEIRTPMNAILGFSNILNKPNLTSVKKKNYINIIQNSGNQLMRIIDDILEISKLGTKQVKTIEKELSKNVGGLGLGLSIAKENAELLGGKITLKSEKGKGSIFYVTIPYKPVNTKIIQNISDINKEKALEKQDKYTILIVEDEEVNYLYIDTLLENFELNLRTLHAKHGKEAVEMCKEKAEIDIVYATETHLVKLQKVQSEKKKKNFSLINIKKTTDFSFTKFETNFTPIFINQEQNNAQNKIIGNLGELWVINYEKNKLENNNLTRKINKIEHTAKLKVTELDMTLNLLMKMWMRFLLK